MNKCLICKLDLSGSFEDADSLLHKVKDTFAPPRAQIFTQYFFRCTGDRLEEIAQFVGDLAPGSEAKFHQLGEDGLIGNEIPDSEPEDVQEDVDLGGPAPAVQPGPPEEAAHPVVLPPDEVAEEEEA